MTTPTSASASPSTEAIPAQIATIAMEGGKVTLGPPTPGAPSPKIDVSTAIADASANDWLPKAFATHTEVVSYGSINAPSFTQKTVVDIYFKNVLDEIGPIGGAYVSTPAPSSPSAQQRISINILLDPATGSVLGTAEDPAA